MLKNGTIAHNLSQTYSLRGSRLVVVRFDSPEFSHVSHSYRKTSNHLLRREYHHMPRFFLKFLYPYFTRYDEVNLTDHTLIINVSCLLQQIFVCPQRYMSAFLR